MTNDQIKEIVERINELEGNLKNQADLDASEKLSIWMQIDKLEKFLLLHS